MHHTINTRIAKATELETSAARMKEERKHAMKNHVSTNDLKDITKLSTLALVYLLVFAMNAPALAATRTWDADGADNYWATDANWSDDTAPVDGDTVNMNGGAKSTPIDADHIADLNGVSVNLPASLVRMLKGSEGGFRIEDNAGGATLTCDIFHVQQGGRPAYEVDVPIIANTEIRTRYRLGGVKFFQTLTAPKVDLGRGDRVDLFADVNATTEFNVVKNDNKTNAYLSPHPDTAVVPTLTTPAVLVDDSTSKFYADGIVATNTVTVQNAGQYYAQRDGAMGDSATTVAINSSGKLYVPSSQSSAGTVNVGANGYASFTASGINLANLALHTPFDAGASGAEISAVSDVTVSGIVSGNGGWGGAGTLTVAGTLAPGNSVGVISGTIVAISSGGAYELEIRDPDGAPGTGWDLIIADSLTFNGPWTLDVVDLGVGRDILPTDVFEIATLGSTNLVAEDVSLSLPEGWRVDGGPFLSLDTSGNLMLSNLSTLPVPEPSTLVLAGLGLVGLAIRRRQ